ncbi:restriction endonuclease [Syntrophotalea acetylenica]|uniref:Restriction endonuclease type IV Mrr domain-containing protein n=1 Tax=Syntrophotalea acetylenica TaxID=29542 RepID=A0A1L3GJA2_SYNAC|nr:restriction endonuclease [Syntrophotalea acetylenica]APG25960.1 hypothetical protein A7E75_13805 [Syntrophotalea acetylenica]APG44028.1 hypothetical protein A6070_07830 [Syntrophotalea acetylenica]
MPKRSNAFQQVVTLLHKQFKNNGIITESKFLCDSITGKLREVDIVIETKVTNYTVFLSIECIDHKRPATVEWVEKMIGKHQNLPTSRLVLVSKSGFTKNAEKKAQAYNAVTLSLKEAERTCWPDILTIETLIAKYDGFLMVFEGEGIKLLPPSSNWVLYDKNEGIMFPVKTIIEFLIKKPEIGESFLQHMAREGKDQNNFTLDFNFPHPLCCKGFDNQELEVVGLRVLFSANKTIVPIFLSQGEIAESYVAFGEPTDNKSQLQAAFIKKDNQEIVSEVRIKEDSDWLNLIKVGGDSGLS